MISAALFLAMQQDQKPEKPLAVKPLDVVEAHYTGKLTNGKVFDSSVPRGKPFKFQVGIGQVIKGWDKGFIGLLVGEKKTLNIPAADGYGAQGAGEDIPPNSDLIFDVEVVRIVPAAQIEVLKEGTGEPMKERQAVECKIKLQVKDGKVLTDKPDVVNLAIARELPAGINQGIAGIKAGEKRRVTLNSDLMYGEFGVPARDTPQGKAGSVIPGKATIIFEIEALKIVNY